MIWAGQSEMHRVDGGFTRLSHRIPIPSSPSSAGRPGAPPNSAMITRGALARQLDEQARQASYKIELSLLPPEILLSIARSVPLVDLFTLGICCKNLAAVAAQGELWKRIELPRRVAIRCTDTWLAHLLERVDARSHTESISLKCCIKVSGSGLSPLQGSTALREVDLRRGVLSFDGVEQLAPLSPSVIELLAPMMVPHPTGRQLTSLRFYRKFDFCLAPLVDPSFVPVNKPRRRYTLHTAQQMGCHPCIKCFDMLYEVEGLPDDLPPDRLPYIGDDFWDGVPKPDKKCRMCKAPFCKHCAGTLRALCFECGKWVCKNCLADDADGWMSDSGSESGMPHATCIRCFANVGGYEFPSEEDFLEDHRGPMLDDELYGPYACGENPGCECRRCGGSGYGSE